MLLNGWSFGPVFTVQSGAPYNYGLSGGTALAGGTSTFNGSGGRNYVNFWAYRNLAGNQGLPDIRRNSKRQTTIEDVDLRVSRSFAVMEKYHLKLLAESFNLMNRQNFTAFNTTAYTLSGTTATYQSTFGTLVPQATRSTANGRYSSRGVSSSSPDTTEDGRAVASAAAPFFCPFLFREKGLRFRYSRVGVCREAMPCPDCDGAGSSR